MATKRRLMHWAVLAAASAGTLGYISYNNNKSKHTITNSMSMFCLPSEPVVKPTRQVLGSNILPGYHLTLFQYNNCPFSSKVRAFLNYYSLDYDVVEVSPFRRSQLNFSPVKTIPMLLASGDAAPSQVLVDSSAIISILKTCAVKEKDPLPSVTSLYEIQVSDPVLDSQGNVCKVRRTPDIPNKYFVMYGDKTPAGDDKDIGEEQQWRKWVDNTLVHLIAPNVYRSPVEAFDSLSYFRQVLGDESLTKQVLAYPASVVMYALGRLVKHRHHIEGNERDALHKALANWSRAIGKSRFYLGGPTPNLADLAVYGVLNSIEGCQAFKEAAAKNTEFKNWFYRMQDLVNNQAGLHSLPQSFRKKHSAE